MQNFVWPFKVTVIPWLTAQPVKYKYIKKCCVSGDTLSHLAGFVFQVKLRDHKVAGYIFWGADELLVQILTVAENENN